MQWNSREWRNHTMFGICIDFARAEQISRMNERYWYWGTNWSERSLLTEIKESSYCHSFTCIWFSVWCILYENELHPYLCPSVIISNVLHIGFCSILQRSRILQSTSSSLMKLRLHWKASAICTYVCVGSWKYYSHTTPWSSINFWPCFLDDNLIGLFCFHETEWRFYRTFIAQTLREILHPLMCSRAYCFIMTEFQRVSPALFTSI